MINVLPSCLGRFRASPVNDIFCQSLPGSPLKPHNLEQLEKQQEMLKMPFRRVKEVGLVQFRREKRAFSMV